MQDCNENQQNASQGFGEAAPTNLQEEKKPMAIIKCLLVGGAASGKSSILLSYVDKAFSETYLSTIGVDFKVNTVQYQNQLYKLQIWDTAGQERFKSITTAYYKGALCFFLIYDTTNYNQFLKLSSHLKEICEHGGQNGYVCLVGTKCDLITQKKVSTEMGMQFAHENKLDFMQVTAIPSQNNHQLDDLFMRGVKWLLKGNSAEQKKFKAIIANYISGFDCFYLVYDCTNEIQFLSIPKFLNQIEKFGNQNSYKCLVGTKCDLVNQKEVSTQMGMQFASQNKIDFMEVSAIPNEIDNKLDQLFMKGVEWYAQNK